MLVTRNNNWMPALFNEFLNLDNWNNSVCETTQTMPKMNVSESDNDYRMELCVPGLKKEDLNICIDTDNNLVIEMVKTNEHNEEKKEGRKYLRHEFSTMQFKQMFSLPENVKKENISAKVEHGVLTIELPKFTAEEKKALAQNIEIK
ncbi:MAG: Hsp20/alpha crystallin family protein [Bacteroidales bacterium]|nr:Hsp20/alpha crystallin family protein [Bacteroidales bacterium]